MSLKNRTSELLSAINSLQSSSSSPLRHRTNTTSHPDSTTSPLLGLTPATSLSSVNSTSSLSSSNHPPSNKPHRSQFSLRASHIARAIHSTTLKLEKLGKLAKRRTLFDDRPVEITELTSVIKNDITSLNDQIRQLQYLVQSQNARSRAGKHEEEHSQSVVVVLQSSLAKTSQGFAQILEIRTENMKAQKERRDQFAASAVPSLGLDGPGVNSPLLNYNRQSGPTDPGGMNSLTPLPLGPSSSSSTHDNLIHTNVGGDPGFLSIDMGLSADQTQAFAISGSSSDYLDQRNTAIESIESTIVELGQIFQQLGTLVAQQQDQVRRIDDNVMDVETNVELARKELFKYWTSGSSNRMLMVKMFAVVLVFFMIFVVLL